MCEECGAIIAFCGDEVFLCACVCACVENVQFHGNSFLSNALIILITRYAVAYALCQQKHTLEQEHILQMELTVQYLIISLQLQLNPHQLAFAAITHCVGCYVFPVHVIIVFDLVVYALVRRALNITCIRFYTFGQSKCARNVLV